MRTGWAKKSKPTLSTHNFVKYWPIFKILSLSHCPGNLQYSNHYSLNIPPHLERVATLPCEIFMPLK